MSKTTIDLPEDVLARIIAVADRAGTTPEQFVLDAIAEKIDMDERAAALDAEDEARYAEVVRSGETVSLDDMQMYFERRLRGEAVTPPVPKKTGPYT